MKWLIDCFGCAYAVKRIAYEVYVRRLHTDTTGPLGSCGSRAGIQMLIRWNPSEKKREKKKKKRKRDLGGNLEEFKRKPLVWIVDHIPLSRSCVGFDEHPGTESRALEAWISNAGIINAWSEVAPISPFSPLTPTRTKLSSCTWPSVFVLRIMLDVRWRRRRTAAVPSPALL